MEGNAPVYQVYPVSRINGEGRAEVLRSWEPGFDQEGAWGGLGGGRAGKLSLFVETRDKSDGFG